MSRIKMLTDINIPTQEEIFAQASQSSNQNIFSKWFHRFAFDNKGKTSFRIPKSLVYPLSFEEWDILHCGQPIEDTAKIEAFNARCNALIRANGLNYPIFMKSGLFSNKFEFDNCVVNNENEIYAKFWNIHFNAIAFGVPYDAEIVFREFIPTAAENTIYYNMPLNMEYRVFYDFDNKQVLDITDYWHESIKEQLPQEQQARFAKIKADTKADFMQSSKVLKRYLNEDIFPTGLSGVWSLDFMVDKNGDAWFIDAAIASQSWGVHLLSDEHQALIFKND